MPAPRAEPTPLPADGPAAARRPWIDWAIWLVLRLVALAIIIGWIPWPELVNDLTIYGTWVTDSLQFGRFPTDEMWQYPPLAGPVFVAGSWLPGQRVGFALLFLAFDAAIMAMLARQAGRTGRSAGTRLWALLPVIVGPLILARFDVVPTAFAVAAVLAAARPMASGVLAASGAWLQVWPLLVLAAVRRRDLPRAALGALGASALIAGVLAVTTDEPMSFLTGQRDRGLQIESLAAWPFLVARALGAPVEVIYRYGAHEVEAAGVDLAARGATLATLVLLAIVAIQRLRGALEPLPGADVALATVLFSVATSRVFSGQYFIWLLALAAVCLSDPGSRMRRTIWLLIAAGLATHLVYPWLYSALLAGSPLAVLVQTVRVGLTLAATGTALVVLVHPARAHASGSPPSSISRSRSADRSQPHDDSTH
ncbi:MAG: glycosyltransferase 87 family protein [Actinomycetota bacterium]|nr:glycosyltransferase 87 family protein [Actinomycetota bacterium]